MLVSKTTSAIAKLCHGVRRAACRNACVLAHVPLRYGACLMAVALLALPANADRIENRTAVFAGLDKVTAQISTFEVELGKTAKFGALKVTPRACYSRPATELPKTTTFVEVDEVQLDGSEKRIFTGWMFAESPGLHGVEHPTIDVWLNACKDRSRVVTDGRRRPTSGDPIADIIEDGNGGDPLENAPRRRVRR